MVVSTGSTIRRMAGHRGKPSGEKRVQEYQTPKAAVKAFPGIFAAGRKIGLMAIMSVDARQCPPREKLEDRSPTGRAYSSYFLNTRQAFWPPKPKLFESATRTALSLATLGT